MTQEQIDEFTKKHLDIIWRKIREALIESHIKPMYGGLEMASIEYFSETGSISGSFYSHLMRMMDALRVRSSFDEVLTTTLNSHYLPLLSAEREKVRKLREGLGKIDAISFHKNEWTDMANIGEIVKQLLSETTD